MNDMSASLFDKIDRDYLLNCLKKKVLDCPLTEKEKSDLCKIYGALKEWMEVIGSMINV
jgi:hypothetical protein